MAGLHLSNTPARMLPDKTARLHADEYVGTIEQLVAAKLAEPHMFPGQPNRGKTTCTYRNGQLVTKGSSKGRHDDSYLQIVRLSSRKFRLIVGLTAEERHQREEQMRQAAISRAPRPNTGEKSLETIDTISEAALTFGLQMCFEIAGSEAAKFRRGEGCRIWAPGSEYHENTAEITRGLNYYKVHSETGSRRSEDGRRFDYLLGYWAKEPGGREYFYAAHELRTLDRQIKHLRLVHSS